MRARRSILLEPGSTAWGPRFGAPLRGKDYASAALGGAVAFAVYLLTLAPTVTGEDSGELAAAAFTLGIPHPPGYPLWCLVGKGFMSVFPFGEVAWRLNLLSALLSALSVALAILLAIRLSAPRPAALACGLLAAFTANFWSQATITEVYPLAAVCLLAVLHLALSFVLDPEPRRLWALAYVSGLALTAHPSLVLLLPGLAVLVIARLGGVRREIPNLLCSAGFFLLGFSVYLYLPLRSLADPQMDWGDPESLSSFLYHVLRLQYRGLTPEPARPVLDRALYLGHVVLFEVGVLASLLSVLGLKWLLRFPGDGFWPAERRRVRIAFRAAYVLWLLFFGPGLLFVLHVSFERRVLALNSVFFIPLLLLCVAPAALGLTRVALGLTEHLGRLRGHAPAWAFRAQKAAWAAGFALPLALLLWNYPAQDRSDYTIARDYAEALLETLPEGAVYLPLGDYATFPVLYLQIVEGKRPDVVTGDKYGYLDPRVLKRLCGSPEEFERVRNYAREDAERWLIDRSGRPVFVNAKRAIPEIPTENFTPVGLLYRVDRGREKLEREEAERLWRSYRFGNLDAEYRWVGGMRDIAGDFILAEILFHRADRSFDEGAAREGLCWIERLGEALADQKEVLHNAGSLLRERGFPEEARRYYERALALDADYALCRYNLALLLLEEGLDLERGLEHARRALEDLGPDPALLKAVAEAHVERRRWGRALEAFLAVADLAPGDSEPWRRAGEIAEEHLGRAELAKRYYGESLRRKPAQPALIEKVHGKEARERYERLAAEALRRMSERRSPLAALPADVGGAVRGGSGFQTE